MPGAVPYTALKHRETRDSLAASQSGEGNSNMASDVMYLFAINLHIVFHINSAINSYTVHLIVDTEATVSLLGTDT